MYLTSFALLNPLDSCIVVGQIHYLFVESNQIIVCHVMFFKCNYIHIHRSEIKQIERIFNILFHFVVCDDYCVPCRMPISFLCSITVRIILVTLFSVSVSGLSAVPLGVFWKTMLHELCYSFYLKYPESIACSRNSIFKFLIWPTKQKFYFGIKYL
jgi:hypothetical protein